MKKIIAIPLLLLIFPVVVSERYEVGQYGVAANAGYYNYSTKRDLDNGAITGASFSYVMAPNFSGELSFDGANPQSSMYDENQNFYNYMADGVYHFTYPNSDFSSFVVAGLGVTDQRDEHDNGNTTLLNVNAGVGAEYFFSRSVSLFAQAVDLYTLSGGKNDWVVQGGIKCLLGHKENEKSQQAQSSRPQVTTQGATGFYELQERPAAGS